MTRTILALAFAAALGAAAQASELYDRSIDRAAMQIVASKIDGLRGAFAYDQEPEMIVSYEAMTTNSIPSGVWQDGLARATERR